jgi:hypothetical protein
MPRAGDARFASSRSPLPARSAAAAGARGNQVARHELETVGAATSLKLTATTNPNGLQADAAT